MIHTVTCCEIHREFLRLISTHVVDEGMLERPHSYFFFKCRFLKFLNQVNLCKMCKCVNLPTYFEHIHTFWMWWFLIHFRAFQPSSTHRLTLLLSLARLVIGMGAKASRIGRDALGQGCLPWTTICIEISMCMRTPGHL